MTPRIPGATVDVVRGAGVEDEPMSYITAPKTLITTFGLLVALSACPAFVASSHAFGLGGGTKADVESTKKIRTLYEEFVKAWNAHDVKTMSSRWAIDGDHIEPDGTRAQGRDEVAALLTKQHASVFKNSTLELTVKTVFMITDTVAIIDGTYKLTGAVLPDGTPIPARQGMLTSVLLQERGTWSIFASRLMIPTVLPYKPKTPASPSDAAAPKQP
jgi:uncharacterized protein (TIGR02246 family)